MLVGIAIVISLGVAAFELSCAKQECLFVLRLYFGD